MESCVSVVIRARYHCGGHGGGGVGGGDDDEVDVCQC